MGTDCRTTMSEFKVLICGDGAIGKTCLLDTLTERNVVNWDNPDYVPTAAENLEVTWDIDGAGESRIEIWDTAGQETLETLRKTAYPGTQVLLIGFDTTNSVTLENVADTWITEFRGGCSDCPCIILVGTKYDWLKEDPDFHESPCSVDDDSILETAQKIGAHAVVLTSAKTGEGILCTDTNNAEPSFFNEPEDSEGLFLVEVIQNMCSKIYAHDEIPVVKKVQKAAAPAPAPAPAPEPEQPKTEVQTQPAPEPTAPAPAPEKDDKKKEGGCCTLQ